MTKRLLSMILVGVLLLTLTACGGEAQPDVTVPTDDPTTTTTAAPTIYYVTATLLNVRSNPTTDSEVLGQLAMGTVVDILSTENGWCRILYNGIPAYISADYVSAQQPSATDATTAPTTAGIPANTTVYVTANKLNVRREPMAAGDVLGQLLYGAAVTVLSAENGWCRIDYQGTTAYISADYVSLTAPNATTTATKAPTTKVPTTTKAQGQYPDSTIPPLTGGLTEAERTELYDGLNDILAKNGSDYQSVYTYVNKNKTYRNLAEGKSIEAMAYYALTHKSSSCYYFAAFTYLLMKQAGYQVSFVRGLGWQNGTEHCWIMFKEADGWYFMDSLYVRSAKLTTKQCKEIGYKWNPTIHPEAK